MEEPAVCCCRCCQLDLLCLWQQQLLLQQRMLLEQRVLLQQC